MQPVPNHPYVHYEAKADALGRWWITCICTCCGDQDQRRCLRPARTNERVFKYALLHSHGLRPVMAGCVR